MLTEKESARAVMQAAREYTALHLADMAKEILDWHATGLLRSGHVRINAHNLRQVSNHDALSLAEKLVNEAALDAVSRQTE